jgi:hypothetical protein
MTHTGAMTFFYRTVGRSGRIAERERPPSYYNIDEKIFYASMLRQGAINLAPTK